MEGTPLLEVLNGLITNPEAQADYNADPSGYMQRFGYDDVDAEHMNEAIGLVADTLPPDVAQAVSTATDTGDGEAGGDVTDLLGRLTELDIDASDLGVTAEGEDLASDPGGMDYGEGDDLDPFDGDLDEIDADADAGYERASFGDDPDDDGLDSGRADDFADDDFGGGLGEALGSAVDPAAGRFGEGSAPDADEGDEDAGAYDVDSQGGGLGEAESAFDLGLDDDLAAVPGYDADGGYDDEAGGDDLDELDDVDEDGADGFGSPAGDDDIGFF